MLCHAVLCYVVLCCVMLCYVVLCCAMLCYVVLGRAQRTIRVLLQKPGVLLTAWGSFESGRVP